MDGNDRWIDSTEMNVSIDVCIDVCMYR